MERTVTSKRSRANAEAKPTSAEPFKAREPNDAAQAMFAACAILDSSVRSHQGCCIVLTGLFYLHGRSAG